MSEVEARPQAGVNEEAGRIAAAMARTNVPLRLIGGGAIYLRCPSARVSRLRRTYADLDFVGLSSYTVEISRFFEELGYKPDRWFNKLHGRARLLFWDETNDRQADVFLDRMNMCHRLEFRTRLEVDPHTLSLADLLLTKLQIVQMNKKDLIDIVAMLVDHPIGNQDGETINGEYIARLAANSWGLFTTVTQNLDLVREAAGDFDGVGGLPLVSQLDVLLAFLAAAHKSVAWRLRSIVGGRIRWYEEPEEVRRA